MNNSEENARITSFDGLKVIAVLIIFFWHSSLPRPGCDLGARCCEFFFVVSGFLTGYRYIRSDFPSSLKEHFKYFAKKVITFWPLHCFCLFLIILITFDFPKDLHSIKLLLTNLFLFQSWFNDSDIFFSYNGVSWFLSSIMFCYLTAPLIIKSARKRHISIPMFLVCTALRLIWEYAQIKNLMPFSVSFHVYPLVRLLEFCMGMYIVPLFFSISKIVAGNKNRILFTFFEVVSLVGIILLIVYRNDLMRGTFALVFCGPVFVFAFNKGLVSSLLSVKPFELCSKIQMELFMLHPVVNSMMPRLLPDNKLADTLIKFVVTIVVSVVYRYVSKNDALTAKLSQKINNF